MSDPRRGRSQVDVAAAVSRRCTRVRMVYAVRTAELRTAKGMQEARKRAVQGVHDLKIVSDSYN